MKRRWVKIKGQEWKRREANVRIAHREERRKETWRVLTTVAGTPLVGRIWPIRGPNSVITLVNTIHCNWCKCRAKPPRLTIHERHTHTHALKNKQNVTMHAHILPIWTRGDGITDTHTYSHAENSRTISTAAHATRTDARTSTHIHKHCLVKTWQRRQTPDAYSLSTCQKKKKIKRRIHLAGISIFFGA